MSLTWLHVSDFHIRGGDPYDRDVVLRALVKSVADYRDQGRIADVIFATGDIAHSGKPEEYKIAGSFFDELLAAAHLERDRLFVIPGNHDVERDLGVGLARTLDSREKSDGYFRLDRPKPHLSQKLRAYLEWHDGYFSGVRKTPIDSTCGPLEFPKLNNGRIAILPINSALFCEDDNDHGKLWIGRRCLDKSLEDLAGAGGDFITIALIHHPLDWLNPIENAHIQEKLEASAHILLRGHLHETRLEIVSSAEGELLRCAAGAAYQTTKWPNRALYGTLTEDGVRIFPIAYTENPREIWTTDSSTFPRDPGHERTFPIRLKGTSQHASHQRPSVSSVPPPRFRSNIQSRGNRPFVGRDDLLVQIGSLLSDITRDAAVVLHGPPGVGKSELAREFARLNREKYPGGTFLIDASTNDVAINLASIGQNILDLSFPEDMKFEDRGRKAFAILGATPTLLLYDNVVSFDDASPWLPFAGMPCHVLMTTLADNVNVIWPRVEVSPLSRQSSLELVDKLTDFQLPRSSADAIVQHAAGLPLQILPDAATLAYEQKRGRSAPTRFALAREAGSSFRAAYSRLDQSARLLLHAAVLLNSQNIQIAELGLHLREGLGWSEGDFQRVFDTCLDLHLLEGSPASRMHQLFAAFVRATTLSDGDQAELSKIRQVQAARFVKLAEKLWSNPTDLDTATALLAYPLVSDDWSAFGVSLSVDDGETFGKALWQIGRFAEARPWFERAVAEKEKADVNGRIDHASLGSSLSWVGACFSNTGRYEEARPWFERSVAEMEKGDVHGCLDHESLGNSLHQVGYCFSRTGRYEEALPWFERSVAETEKGNVHGRIDHESLGRSLNQIGNCFSRTGRYEEALPWFERSVAESEKGDVHGRIDHANLGRSLNQVGSCFSRTGRYEEALPWFERSVAEKEKGDLHERIDHESLGSSLHEVGNCFSRTGRNEEALPWFERAVAESEKGDVHGRIDHASLGISLNQVGNCFSSTGRNEEALPWFERSVAEKEKGDVHGRIDHESLGTGLHQVGDCFSGTGRYEEALPWFERAVAEVEKGDVHGRIDHESLWLSVQALVGCLRRLGQQDAASALENRYRGPETK